MTDGRPFLLGSVERGGGQGADAVERGAGRRARTGRRRQHQQLLHGRNVHHDGRGTRALVVRQPARALHGPTGAARLRQGLLRSVPIFQIVSSVSSSSIPSVRVRSLSMEEILLL